MRKHSVRKFLHAVLDLLPLLVIPIFAINIINRSAEPLEVTTGSRITRTYDFNQLVKNGLPISDDISNWFFEAEFYYSSEDENNYMSWGAEEYEEEYYEINAYANLGGTCVSGHQYLLKYDIKANLPSSNRFVQVGIRNEEDSNSNGFNVYNNWSTHIDTYVFNFDGDYDWQYVYIYYEPEDNEHYVQISIRNLQLFDLTQMYGAGYEPSITTFKNTWTDSYYDYILSNEITQVISDTTVTYNNTDIGSQFLYSVYIPIHDYFNFGNVFNLGQVYDWFNANLFSYQAQLITTIVWNIIVYEFLMDILFLVYGIFMFIIDFAECLMDKPFNIKRGR